MNMKDTSTLDIRTPRGKLVGKYDEKANIFIIKDGNKITQIEVPSEGLRLRYSSGDGVVEDVYIRPSSKDKHHVA